MQELISGFSLSVCICTRNRMQEVLRAIDSLMPSRQFIHEVIVSDDSTNGDTYELVSGLAPVVRYTRGPQRGLSANRNHALQRVSGSHVLFIDDDVVLGSNFIPAMISYLKNVDDGTRDRVIVTGVENKLGQIVIPHEQSFLGFQRKKYREDDATIRTIVINSTIFPRSVFNILRFDEHLTYGYEEVDISTRASYQGFSIKLCHEAVNYHYPSVVNRDYYKPYINASRLYVTFKRYALTERNLAKGMTFLFTAMCHVMISSLLAEGFKGGASGIHTVRLALTYILGATALRRNGLT